VGRRRQVLDPSRVAAYVRVSTDEQAVSGLGLEAQEAAIRRGAELRGYAVVASFSDLGVSGSVAPEARPGLTAALAAVRAGAGTLMVAKRWYAANRQEGPSAAREIPTPSCCPGHQPGARLGNQPSTRLPQGPGSSLGKIADGTLRVHEPGRP
jgi:hypothetical protein